MRAVALPALLVVIYLLLEWWVPLGSAVQLGADEGFELSKATLCLHGHSLYREVWNDQPPLHTWLVCFGLRHGSGSVGGARLLTVGFAVTLLVALFSWWRQVSGWAAAFGGVLLLMFSPGFVELSSSCMLELPSLATACVALALLARSGRGFRWEAAAGVVFGLALMMKLVPAMLLVVAGLVVWAKLRGDAHPGRQVAGGGLVLFASLLVSFVLADWVVNGGAFLRHFGQTWASHFGAGKSVVYGSAAEHAYDWRILARNWDTSLPALVGIVLLARRARADRTALLPLGWLAWSLLVFGIHRPWWPYYYIHTALPLCWCAGEGWVGAFGWLRRKRSRWWLAGLAVFALAAGLWAGGRVYLQLRGMRLLPRTYAEPVLAEMARFRDVAGTLYAEDTIYSFHADIPMVPEVAVLPLKRFWTGDITAEGVAKALAEARPGLVLLRNTPEERPFQLLLASEYRPIYLDDEHRLFVRNDLAHQGNKSVFIRR